MYKFNRVNINKNAVKYQFLKLGDKNLTYSDFINLLKCRDKNFFSTFKQSLKDANSKFPAYFWECPSVSKNTLERSFEFVVTKSRELNRIKQNYESFAEYFRDDNGNVCSFLNLGKDATLISPIPKLKSDYKNISQFTNNAPDEQQQFFWQEVADQLEKSLDNKNFPKWLSTNGLSVHFLHVRIDSSPKYYSCNEYRKEVTQQVDKRKKKKEKFDREPSKKRFQGRDEYNSVDDLQGSMYDSWSKEQFIAEIERLKARILELESGDNLIALKNQEKKEELEKTYINIGSKPDNFSNNYPIDWVIGGWMSVIGLVMIISIRRRKKIKINIIKNRSL